MKPTHDFAGKIVRLKVTGRDPQHLNGAEFQLEDWWENIAGQSWMDSVSNPAAILYAMRAAFAGIPPDNNVVYGKVCGLGYLVHISELDGVV